MPAREEIFDAIVIGAGFGGLGAAVHLAEGGARVCLLEALNYPGGCASTFRRAGRLFEAGATLFSGFGEGQLFRGLIDRLHLDVTVDFLDPVVEMRWPGQVLAVPARRDALIDRLCGLPGAPVPELSRFFAMQREVADVLWEVLDDPALLPPFTMGSLLRHAARAPRYLKLLPLLGKPLSAVLEAHGLSGFAALSTFLDALCQITIQCPAREAEAPFALATMDYYFRGTGHVRGGIGQLAWALARAVGALGGDVRFTTAARGIAKDGKGYVVHTRRGDVRGRTVVANLLPETVGRMLGDSAPRTLEKLTSKVATGWGAAMLYLAAVPSGGAEGPCHVEIVQDPGRPFIEGNHLFCSVSGPHDEGRAPAGQRTITVSTHVPMERLTALPPEEKGPYLEGIPGAMREGLARFLPGGGRVSVTR